MQIAINSQRQRIEVGQTVNGLEFCGVRGDGKVILRKAAGFARLSYDPAALGLTLQSAWQGPLNRADYAKGGKYANPIMVRVYERYQGAL